MRRLMSTAKTTMHPAASPRRNYMLDGPAAIRQQHHKQILARVRTICAFPGKRPSVIAGCPPCSMASSANRRRRLSVDLYFLPTSRICLLCARQCRTLSFASRPGCHKAPMAQVSFEPKADSRKWPIGTEATCHRKVKHGTEGKLLTAFSPSQCRAVLRVRQSVWQANNAQPSHQHQAN